MSQAEVASRTEASLSEALASLREVAQARGDRPALLDIEAAEARLRDGALRVAIVGAFKRGKSTLVNALVGEPVLPMGILPVTSAIIEVRHGAEFRCVVEFENRPPVEAGRKDLARFVSQAENPDNEQGVRLVRIEHPGLRLPAGSVVVDTPGVASASGENTATTQHFLRNVDVALLVVAVDPPPGAEEVAFATSLRELVPEVVVALNKVDRVSSSEATEVASYAKDALSHALSGVPVVLPVSAKRALEGDAASLEALVDVLSRLVRERRAPLRAAAASRAAARALARLSSQVEAEARALDASDEEIARIQSAAARLRAERGARARDLEHLARGRVDDVRASLTADADRFAEEAASRLLAKPAWASREEEKRAVSREVEAWYDAEEALLVKRVEGVASFLRGHAETEIARASRELGLPTDGTRVPDEERVPWSRQRLFYFQWVGEQRGLLETFTAPLASKPSAEERVRRDVSVNVARAANDLADRLAEALRVATRLESERVGEFLAALDESVERALRARRARGDELEALRERHVRQVEALARARSLLAEAGAS